MDSLLGGGWPRRRVSVEVAHRLGRRCGEHDVEKLQGPARDLADLKDGLLGQLWAVAGTKGRGNGGGRETSKKGERYGGRRRRSSSRGISIRCRDPPSAVASLHSRTPSHPSHRSMDAVPALGACRKRPAQMPPLSRHGALGFRGREGVRVVTGRGGQWCVVVGRATMGLVTAAGKPGWNSGN